MYPLYNFKEISVCYVFFFLQFVLSYLNIYVNEALHLYTEMTVVQYLSIKVITHKKLNEDVLK